MECIPQVMLPTFAYAIEIWGGDLKNFHYKVLEKGMKIHMMSHIKVCIATTCHILFGELPMELYALKVNYTLSTMAFPLPSSWLVSQTTSLSQHVADQWANTWHNLTTIWKASWVYLIEKPMQTRHHNSYLMIPRRVFLLKSGTLSISQG